MAGVGVGCVAGDTLVAHEFRQGLFDGLHALGASGFNVGPELMIISAANQVADSNRGHEDLNGGVSIDSVDCRHEPLMNDSQQGKGELTAHLGLKAGGEDVEDA